jgi:hypothetical protein
MLQANFEQRLKHGQSEEPRCEDIVAGEGMPRRRSRMVKLSELSRRRLATQVVPGVKLSAKGMASRPAQLRGSLAARPVFF